MIDLSAAKKLLNFGARIGDGPRADAQLEGAVAIHNILEKHGVAYLADEVGMGKTYVALGALALFRHFKPDFRVLVIAPRENIQKKWMKEYANFVTNNVRFPDLRIASIERTPVRPLVACDSLLEFVQQVAIDSRRDFFLRLSSFSLALSNDSKGWSHLRDEVRKEVPWLAEETLDLRANKEVFKDNLARALCCAIPVFDLVIVDEGHNLKRGFREGVAARNRVLALAFGHPSQKAEVSRFEGYRPKARRVLFLSATPLEESYEQLWNQLDVFGHGQPFTPLKDSAINDDEKKAIAGKFLVRRVTTIRAGGTDLTKNQYRREWRRGGFDIHDEPIKVEDDRQRLVVALVQKKVAELLGSEKFNMSFQIGMLASFESFLETTRTKTAEGETEANFDDIEQTNDREDGDILKLEREGIDVQDVNRLTRDYRNTFGKEMPHPKMDALVEALQSSWKTGEKALVFVRRIRSVDELKRKLDEKYDEWLLDTLRQRLPPGVLLEFDRLITRYREAKANAAASREAPTALDSYADAVAETNLDDRGGNDTFFAWFFRGDGPKGIVSGANVQQRFIKSGTVYSTFFEQNYVMALLGAESGQVLSSLADCLSRPEQDIQIELNQRAQKYLGRAKKLQRGDRFEAAQAAAMEMLKNHKNIHQERARIIWHERFQDSIKLVAATEVADVAGMLEEQTFFSLLQSPGWTDLRQAIWPAPKYTDSTNEAIRDAFREQELRALMLATAARLGHALIDLYILTIRMLGSLRQRTLDTEDDGSRGSSARSLTEYLALLEHQRRTPRSERDWGAFDELADVAGHFDLILDVNAPEARGKPLAETARYFGALLRQQQPIGGMSGKINKTLVQQFRMPGYPLVLITTDLLQEGEDLHTFCSAVHHYGVAWTPSSMEQRIGRIDRVRSKTDRCLNGCTAPPSDDHLLQVYFPHLEDTVEVLQVRRVLERMNTFLRLMHEGLSTQGTDNRRIDVAREMIANLPPVELIKGTLRTAFPIPKGMTRGSVSRLQITDKAVKSLLTRFQKLAKAGLNGYSIEWERPIRKDQLLGTARLSDGRIQPFALLCNTLESRLLVRCISPIGLVGEEAMSTDIAESARRRGCRIGAILGRDGVSYDLTVEGDCLLADPKYDGVRVGQLLHRVLSDADALEQLHLPGRDETFGTFQKDLTMEGGTNHG